MAHPASNRTISPFVGEPETERDEEADGTPVFIVTARELTPERTRWARRLTGGSVLAMIAANVPFYIAQDPYNPLVWFISIGVPLLFMKPVERFFLRKLRKKTVVAFSPAQFRIWDGIAWLRFDRNLRHRFVMQRHDRTREEQEKNEARKRRAEKRGEVIRPARYFSESYHIVFEYMGHRHDVLTVFDKARAMNVLARLKACDEFMNTRARMSDGEVLSPDEQWSDQPGGVPAGA